jgi:hypothetical protein|tara:strand:- start:1235 stop:1468 length:234 start_codon:yes stop_codon:yes gene_type:complete
LLKEGDIVELLPTNNRNRQLRAQEGKHEWEVLKIDPRTICFNNNEGILIQSVKDRKHERWVERNDIALIEYREHRRD